MIDFPTPVAALTRLKVPRNFNGRNPQMRRDLASALRTRPTTSPRRRRRTRPPQGGDGLGRARRTTRSTGCARSSRRTPATSARTARTTPGGRERWFKLDRDAKTLRRRVEQRTNTVARQFDRVCEVLTALDYLDGRHRHRPRQAPDADLLRRRPARRRVAAARPVGRPVAVRARGRPVGAGLRGPPSRRRRARPGCPAGRSRTPSPRWCGSGASSTRSSGSTGSTSSASPTSASRGRRTAGPRATTSTRCSASTDLAAGDFVRWMKQLLDLAGQVADAAGDTPLRRTAREVVARLRRGVVAYSSLRSDEHATLHYGVTVTGVSAVVTPFTPARDQVGVHVARADRRARAPSPCT